MLKAETKNEFGRLYEGSGTEFPSRIGPLGPLGALQRVAKLPGFFMRASRWRSNRVRVVTMRPHFDHGEAAAADVIFKYQGRFLRGDVMGSQSGRGQSDA